MKVSFRGTCSGPIGKNNRLGVKASGVKAEVEVWQIGDNWYARCRGASADLPVHASTASGAGAALVRLFEQTPISWGLWVRERADAEALLVRDGVILPTGREEMMPLRQAAQKMLDAREKMAREAINRNADLFSR